MGEAFKKGFGLMMGLYVGALVLSMIDGKIHKPAKADIKD